jgi:hypothetical protein
LHDHDLHQLVARKTGEDFNTVVAMGFSVLGPIEIEERLDPLVLDWDEHNAQRC